MEKDNGEILNTSLKAIKYSIEGKYTKAFAFYILVKGAFSNGVIYNYRSRKKELAFMAEISERSVYKYIDILIKNNLAYEHHGNLCMKSVRVLKRELSDCRKCKLVITPKDNLHTIECKLYAKLFEYHAKKMAYEEQVMNVDADKCDSAGKQYDPVLSCRSVAKLFNRSVNKARDIINTLNRMAIIRTIKSKPQKVMSNAYGFDPEYTANTYRYYFLIGNDLYCQRGSTHILLQFNVCYPKLSYKQVYKQLAQKNFYF